MVVEPSFENISDVRTIDIRSLSSGCYILKIFLPNDILFSPFIKN